LDIKKLHEHKTNEVNTATGKRFGSFLNKVKDEPPKAVCKDIETLQKHNLLIDTKLNTELSLLKEKLKNIDNDNRSCKTNKKNNSSLILQTNETEKISSNVDTQINTQNKLFEDNTSKQKKTFVNTSVSEYNCKGLNEDSCAVDLDAKSVNSNNSRVSYMSQRKNFEKKSILNENSEKEMHER